MRGTVFRRCWCRDPATKRPYTAGSPCPKLSQRKHGKWYARYDSAVPGRRQPVLGPFGSRSEAEEELAGALAREGGGGTTLDRSMRACAYLDEYMRGKRNLKASTRETDEEAFRLYWKPAIGPRMRLAELRDRHVSQVIDEMLRVNRPLAEGEQPSEMLRRMTEARADDERRALAEGEERHKKSPKPLSPARIERMFAPFRAAMNAAVKTGKIVRSPCDGVELPRAPKRRPLAWTPAREERFRAELARRTREAEAAAEEQGRALTEADRQRLWAAPGLRPVPSMVWLPSQTGQFLDYIEEHGDRRGGAGKEKGERLGVLYLTDAYCGLRRDEITGLHWTEVDLDAGIASVLETGGGEGPKSESGARPVPLPEIVVDALRAWRRAQAAERLSWGPDYQDTGLVFTREDGAALAGPWVSTRFETLAFRAKLPPVRFHDLRHGAASMLKAAGIDTKIISAILGHSRTSFTDAAYVTLFPDVERIAADAAAAVVPRKVKRRGGAAG